MHLVSKESYNEALASLWKKKWCIKAEYFCSKPKWPRNEIKFIFRDLAFDVPLYFTSINIRLHSL